MSWTYRAPRCSYCGFMAVTSTEDGKPLCASHSAQVDDGRMYQERAHQLYLKFSAIYAPDQLEPTYYAAIPDPMSLTWRQIAERLAGLLPTRATESGS